MRPIEEPTAILSRNILFKTMDDFYPMKSHFGTDYSSMFYSGVMYETKGFFYLAGLTSDNHI